MSDKVKLNTTPSTIDVQGDAWVLHFPAVGDSVRVTLNGQSVGVVWAHPFALPVVLQPGRNELICEVTNLSANRVTAADRQGVPWRNFHEINFVNIHYKPFDASTWEPRPSGLLRAPELTSEVLRQRGLSGT